ncbi:MAG: hypothetical protein QOE54_2944 [Streptosporangiaceae bacterium]|jgi:uncharacterized protein YbbK (DUF523 family)|nr:hypothetical protein [Streptosporangiaceae bacterium]
MERILVSACLLGHAVRYDGGAKNNDDELLARWRREGRLVAFCPEISGGLPVPRPPAEIGPARPAAGTTAPLDGAAVLAGTAQVRTAAGVDVTEFFVRGATLAWEAARRNAVRMAILKEGSPSCGSHRIYDGTFAGISVPGAGVTTALLTRHGIKVFSEDQLPQADEYLRALEQPGE